MRVQVSQLRAWLRSWGGWPADAVDAGCRAGGSLGDLQKTYARANDTCVCIHIFWTMCHAPVWRAGLNAQRAERRGRDAHGRPSVASPQLAVPNYTLRSPSRGCCQLCSACAARRGTRSGARARALCVNNRLRACARGRTVPAHCHAPRMLLHTKLMHALLMSVQRPSAATASATLCSPCDRSATQAPAADAAHNRYRPSQSRTIETGRQGLLASLAHAPQPSTARAATAGCTAALAGELGGRNAPPPMGLQPAGFQVHDLLPPHARSNDTARRKGAIRIAG